MGKGLRLFRRFVVIVYWAALPLCLLVAVAALFNAPAPNWPLAAAAAAFALLVMWRLRLNRLALGHSAAVPGAGRLVRVFLPLGVLALLGVLAILLGLAWIVIAIVMARDPSMMIAPELAQASTVYPWLLGGSGVILVGIGAAVVWPFVRLFRKTPAVPSSPQPQGAIEDGHD